MPPATQFVRLGDEPDVIEIALGGTRRNVLVVAHALIPSDERRYDGGKLERKNALSNASPLAPSPRPTLTRRVIHRW